jgi:tetratricopeptide (TPR) repeat protein
MQADHEICSRVSTQIGATRVKKRMASLRSIGFGLLLLGQLSLAQSGASGGDTETTNPTGRTIRAGARNPESGLLAEAHEFFIEGQRLFIDRKFMDAAQQFEDARKSSKESDDPIGEAMMSGWMGQCYANVGQNDSALQAFTERLLQFRRIYGEDDHVMVATSLNDVAYCLNSQGRPAEALPNYQKALRMRQRLFKGDHFLVAASLDGVAFCLNALGRSTEALPKFQEALEMNRRLFQGDHSSVATNLYNVATCLSSLGRFQEALRVCEASLEMNQRLFGHDHPNVATSLNGVASCLDSLGRSTEALPKHQEALEMNRRLFQGDHPFVASNLNNVANSLFSLGRFDEALPKFQEALEMSKRLYDGDHPYVAYGLSSVATCLLSLGRPAEALSMHRESLEMGHRLYEGDHPQVAISLHNTALSLGSLGRLSEALSKLLEALEMRRRLFEGDHPEVALSLNGVADCLASLGRHDEAILKRQETLEMHKRLFEGDHPRVAICLQKVAYSLDALGRSSEALAKHQDAFVMLQRLFQGDHPDVAAGLAKIGSCLEKLGRPTEALAQHQASLEMNQRLFKGDHPLVAICLNHLALCLDDSLGRSSEALTRYQESLEMNQRLYEGDHPELATSLACVAAGLTSIGRSSEALPLHREALEMRHRLFQGNHPDIASSLNSLASSLISLGRSAEALPKLQEALEKRQRLFEGDHPDVALSLNNLAGCLQGLGRFPESLSKQQEALAMYQRIYEGDHPYVAGSLDNLASCLGALDRSSEALPKFQEALEMKQRIFEEDHPATAVSLNNLAHCLHRLGRTSEALPKFQKNLEMMQRVFDSDHVYVAQSLANVASCLSELGRLDEALPKHRESLVMHQRLSSPFTFHSACNLGIYLLGVGDLREAADAFLVAINEIEKAREVVGGDEWDRARYFAQVLSRSGAYEGMVETQLRLDRPDTALEFLERGRCRGLLDLLERGKLIEDVVRLAKETSRNQSASDQVELDGALVVLQEFRPKVADWENQIRSLRGQKSQTKAERGERIAALEQQVSKARRRIDMARRVIYNVVRTALDLDAKSAVELQDLVGQKQRLLIYSVTDRVIRLWIVPPLGNDQSIRVFDLQSPDNQKEPLRRSDLQQAVERFVDGMLQEAGVKRGEFNANEHVALGKRLFDSLIPEGIWEEIRQLEFVYLVPDDALHRLPFETLIVDQTEQKNNRARNRARSRRYWLDEGPPIVYGPSATVLLNRRKAREDQLERGPPMGKAVLLGDPIYHRAKERQVPIPEQGVAVVGVEAESKAANLGIRAGAVITEYAGQSIPNLDAFLKITKDFAAEQAFSQAPQQATLSFWLDGEVSEEQEIDAGRIGVKLENLNERIRLRFARGGPLNATGAIVTRSTFLDRYGRLERLDGTRAEVMRIYESLVGAPFSDSVSAADRASQRGDDSRASKTVSALLGQDATRTELFKRFDDEKTIKYRFLHLATHGLVSEDASKASYSGLALAQPPVPTQSDFGFLTLRDLFDNWWGKLARTELVVLSACDTHRGRIESGEGVYGLPWGFMYAGTPSVVASLWQVSDESTAELMGDFYDRIQRSSKKATRNEKPLKLSAFTEARKSLRKNYPEPFFWAPFIYMGDPR